MVDIEVDSDFNIHTSYHNDFFLLRTKVLVNGQNATITSVKQGVYEEPVLNFRHGGTTISAKLWSLTNTLSPVLGQYGVYHVNTFYYEQSPLFHLVFSSESSLRLFLVKIPKVRSAMQSELQSVLMKTSHVDQTESQSFTVKVQPELFLVSPNLQKTKGAELHLVTTENCSNFVTRWKNSKLFDFGSLYQAEGSSSSTTVTTSVPTSMKQKSLISTQEPPLPAFKKPTADQEWRKKRQGQREFVGRETAAEATTPQITFQPTNLEETTAGKPVTFSIQATGTEPLNYQWQCWKPELGAEEDKSETWQDLTCDGVKFQEVKAGLKLTAVQACDAGYYRCVVSNSAGSETSQCTHLVVVAELRDLVNELTEVNNWIPLGLSLGIKISTLEAIEMERNTIGERRTQMLIAWQRQETPTWSAVLQALVEMGMRHLASQLARKHGISVPKSTKDEALGQLQNLPQYKEPTRSKLLAEVQNLRKDISKMDEQLKDSNQQLIDTQKSKQKIHDSINQLLNSIPKLYENVQTVADDKSSLKKELESKERECQLLIEMCDTIKAKHTLLEEKHQKDLELLEEKIIKKRKKIKKLKEELQRKESELRASQQEARTQQAELSQLQAQLKKKHDDMKNLQSENEKLASSCNSAREQASTLIQLTVSLSSDKGKMEQQLTDTKKESDLKSQQIEACNADISRLSKEVEALSCSLQEKQATVSQLERKLQSHQQAAITPEQLLELLKLAPQAAEIERKLQEAEYKKQQAELEREMAVKEMEAQKKFQMHLHAQLETWLKGSIPEPPAVPINGGTRAGSDKPKTHLLSELTWRRLPDMPVPMVGPQSVTVDTAVYIADGYSGIILRYDPHTNELTQLPEYQYLYFTLTELTHQLVMVGGVDTSKKMSKTVGVYAPSQRSWKQPYPPMNTPRMLPAVSTYHQRLVVAGGCDIDDGWTDLASVEILDTSVRHCQWLSTTGLPMRCRKMSATITHGTLYLLGGTLGKKVLSVSLSALTQTDKPPAQWRTLPDAPLEDSTAIAVHGSLLAVGGSHGGRTSSAIHVYDQEKNVWNKVNDLPTEREGCACCLLPSGEILVAGGANDIFTSRMDVAAVKD